MEKKLNIVFFLNNGKKRHTMFQYFCPSASCQYYFIRNVQFEVPLVFRSFSAIRKIDFFT